jgi:hypothetical protein
VSKETKSPFESMICVLSKNEYFELFGLIAKNSNLRNERLTRDIIISKLCLTEEEFKSGALALMSHCLICINKGRYEITQMGKEVFDALTIVEESITIRTKLKAVDLIKSSGYTSVEEFDKILNTLVKNREVREILRQGVPNQYIRMRSARNSRHGMY